MHKLEIQNLNKLQRNRERTCSEESKIEFLEYMTTSEYKEEEKYKGVRHIIYKYLRWYKEKEPCTDCKTFYPYYVMHFDHRPGEKKLFSISTAKNVSQNLEIIQKEIDKCDLVCANCHATRTWTRRKSQHEFWMNPRKRKSVRFK